MVSDNVLDVVTDADLLPAKPQSAVAATRASDVPLGQASIGQGVTLLSGDCRTVLPTLAANSVQCVVTSPPYYALRDYGTAQWDGGDAGCDHLRVGSKVSSASTLRLDGRDHTGPYDGEKATRVGYPFPEVCGKCGARRIDAQIGLEATPDEFIAQMVAVFREVRRVLRDDGTLFLNLGDSYAASSYGSGGGWAKKPAVDGIMRNNRSLMDEPFKVNHGLKPKDLMMMPARVALALQADGWWLRSAIVWAKPNPMPESVTDRPTSAYEMVYLLTKRARYFYDADAVRERIGEETRRNTEFRGESTPYKNNQSFNNSQQIKNYAPAGEPSLEGRNIRNVWTIATSPFSAAHFATFPPELAERCIRAGTSERGCCAACGAPWVRLTERTAMVIDRSERTHPFGRTRASGTMLEPPTSTTTGWAPTCTCHGHFEEVPAAADWISDETGERKTVRVYVPDDNAPPPVPCTILDPFAGAGTALLVADRLQRSAIGIELNTAYTTMAMDRVRADAPLLAADRLFSSWPPAEDPADQRMAADARQRDLFASC